ncbi:MAG: penicillin-binding transpeptidase domain-containing protein [Candidatus Kapabacteria bacterium]|nr:penicillin-binding transpeptidase domain-containing protein [Candidatus Kapabacteria bacterium]
MNAPENEIRQKKFWKFWLVLITVNIGMAIIIWRLIDIQVISNEEYKSKAKRQHESKVNLTPERGIIYDRNGKVIASNFESVSIAIDPRHIQDLKGFANAVEHDYGYSASGIISKVKASKKSFVWITRRADPTKFNKLVGFSDKGLILIREPRRIYQYDNIASQLIGFTDVDNHGLSGLELKWDSLLKGRDGYMIMNRDGAGRLRPAADLPLIPAFDGYSMNLTIDIDLQRIVEHELKTGVENAGAESGTVIALHPKTGEIIAIASYPSYDPHKPGGMSSAFLRMRAITDTYEPGSTFKLITAAAALEENIIKETDTLDGHLGTLTMRSYVIRDVKPLGRISFRQAMEYSSNIILSTVANMMSDNNFYKYLRDFGFGIKTDVDFPGEVTGKLPKPKNFTSSTKRYLGFGYGLSVTPLQMANAYGAVANGGTLMKPYLVSSVFDSEGREVYSQNPVVVRRVISEETAARLTDILKGVVSRGTGKAARVDGLEICGKTGTSQQIVDGRYSKENYTATFAGYFPANDPQVALIVMLDKPRTSIYGGATAAPIFRGIASKWTGANPNTAIANKFVDSTKTNKDSVLVPNIVGLKSELAEDLLKNRGFGLTYSGNSQGIVLAQNPKAHSRTINGKIVDMTIVATDTVQSPDAIVVLKGMPLRSALAILNAGGVKTKIVGNGNIVTDQKWSRNSDGSSNCIIYSK